MRTSGGQEGRRNVPDVPWVNFELPDEVHRRAKSQASLAGKDLYPYLIELIREGVERREAEKKKKPQNRQPP